MLPLPIKALLDFPDAISFGECPVRYETKKTLLVRNVGQRAAKFHIECDGPFRVEPAQGFIGENETKQMDVYFEPLVGRFSQIGVALFA